MFRWAMKSLLDDTGALLGSAAGVGVALLLVLLLDGVFAGASDTLVAYPQAAAPDVWVMQKGVANMHMASSLVDGELVDRVRETPGVAHVEQILYVNSFVEAGGEMWFAYIVGVEPSATRSGPWEMVAGKRSPAAGEVVLPAVLADKAGVALGDDVRVLGERLRVVGLSRETYSLANSIAFVSYGDLQALRELPRAASYVLVTAADGVVPAALATRVMERVPAVNAVTSTRFVENEREVAMQMGVDVVRMMTLVGGALAFLIIAFTLFAHAARRARELAIVKALGARSTSLYGVVLLQAALISFAGWFAAMLFALLAEPLIETVVPEVVVTYVPATAGLLLVAAVLLGLAASLFPAARVARADPARSFSA